MERPVRKGIVQRGDRVTVCPCACGVVGSLQETSSPACGLAVEDAKDGERWSRSCVLALALLALSGGGEM
jgi:hypothetical protein